MKVVKISKSYDFAPVEKVEIENSMAPLEIGVSGSGQLELEAELRLSDRAADSGYEEYFNVDFAKGKATIDLQEIPELREPFLGTGRSQVWIRLPKGTAVIAEAEVHPLGANGLEGAMVLHNENGPLSLENCSGHIHLENENGPTRLYGCSGEFEIDTENGPVSAEKLQGGKLEIESENGPVKLRQAAFPNVKISSENGVIYYESLQLEEGEMSFENVNGVVHLVLPENSGFQLEVESVNGSISTSFEGAGEKRHGRLSLRRGEGGPKISVKTENGTVKIGSDAHAELSFVRLKLKELKGMMGNAVNDADKEKLQETLNKVTAAVEKAVGSVTEAKVKEGLVQSLDKLKEAVENFDLQGTREKVVKTVEQVGDELSDGLKVVFRKMKVPFREGEGEAAGEDRRFRHSFRERGFGRFREHLDPDSIKEYVHKAIDSALSRSGKGLSERERGEVDERSRAKILEMLESGKITAEEAERLLKAIGRE